MVFLEMITNVDISGMDIAAKAGEIQADINAKFGIAKEKISLAALGGLKAMIRGSTDPAAMIVITATPAEIAEFGSGKKEEIISHVTTAFSADFKIPAERIIVRLEKADPEYTAVGGVLLKDLP